MTPAEAARVNREFLDAQERDRAADARLRDLVRASRLTRAEKARVWTWVRAHHPALRALLTSPLYQRLRDDLGAEPMFPRDVVAQANQGEDHA